MKYLTPPEYAATLGVESRKVVAWIRSGELPAFNAALRPTGRPRYRISPADIAVFERRRSGQADPKPTRRRRQPAGNIIEFFK